ncbi:hydroxylamine reductase [Halosquirtibacter xylanolyticus]|uniref:hydroxylamine reductase n=1 Tax=Halosquirtibacter xylanolyticus TaxID=3374599 RepID=UPI003748FAAE|nr:hydroxylamine reductase [Prolixibacteraceae bacterium]
MSMFCFQCQEAAKGTGCTIKGVCGKNEEVANLQDLLMYVVKGIATYAHHGRALGMEDDIANKYIIDALFTTITNANFDPEKITEVITTGLAIRNRLKEEYIAKGGDANISSFGATTWNPETTAGYVAKGSVVGILAIENEDIRSLKELITYGLKGAAAYAEHAWNLDFENKEFHSFIQRALYEITRDDISADELVALTLETGKYGVDVMALLDEANTSTYGNPEITEVNIGVSDKPGILISGHDLKDMEELLKQTEGTGVDVYTHSEMLPANYYPAFKKYSHFVGNYGNAWWKQDKEFASFNGPILMTTNCITPPKSSYVDRVYTTGAAGFVGVKHIPNRAKDGAKDFTQIIEHAKQCEAPIEIEKGKIVGGFAHNQVIQLADKVVDAVKTGAIRKFFVMAGCDGRMKSRDYYTEFAEKLPKDTVILTAGCAKYRYNKLELGDIGGIPRVLDAGQCNDSYSLAVIALKLKEVFELNDINELPIAYNIAWYEQKAVIVLLALLHLGVKNIHLGPTLPAFLSPNVAKVLVDTFGIGGIGTVDEDMKMFMN